MERTIGVEKVINGLKELHGSQETMELISDVITLLKEQEPKTVLHREDGDYCPRCSTISTRAIGVQKLHLGTSYCPYCGQAINWEEGMET